LYCFLTYNFFSQKKYIRQPSINFDYRLRKKIMKIMLPCIQTMTSMNYFLILIRGWLQNFFWLALPWASKIFEQLAPSKFHWPEKYRSKNILVLFGQNPAIWELLIQYLERNVVLEKSYFYTEQSLMITFTDLILINIFIPEFIIWCCMPLIFLYINND